MRRPCLILWLQSLLGKRGVEKMNKKMTVFLLMCLMIVPFAVAGTVTRSFSSATATPDGIISVILEVQVASGDSYYSIDEVYPAGWSVTANGGGDNSQTGHLKWVVISNPASLKYTYTLAVSAGAQSGQFSGKYMFQDSLAEVEIAGLTSLTVSAAAAPTCTDSQKNGQETDVDCGGSCPTKCAEGKSCGINGDCQSDKCENGKCVAVAPAICTETALEGTKVGDFTATEPSICIKAAKEKGTNKLSGSPVADDLCIAVYRGEPIVKIPGENYLRYANLASTKLGRSVAWGDLCPAYYATVKEINGLWLPAVSGYYAPAVLGEAKACIDEGATKFPFFNSNCAASAEKCDETHPELCEYVTACKAAKNYWISGKCHDACPEGFVDTDKDFNCEETGSVQLSETAVEAKTPERKALLQCVLDALDNQKGLLQKISAVAACLKDNSKALQ